MHLMEPIKQSNHTDKWLFRIVNGKELADRGRLFNASDVRNVRNVCNVRNAH